MKNLFQRLTFTFLFGLLFSLMFWSCGDDANETYNAKVSKADALFQNKKYVDARMLYVKASGLKKDEVYPRNQVNKIDSLLAQIVQEKEKKTDSIVVETMPEVVKTPKAKPFVVVVGSFSIEKNAVEFQKELSSSGKTSTIIKSREGNYLVNIKSFTTIHKAYNYIAANKSDLGDSSWVYKL